MIRFQLNIFLPQSPEEHWGLSSEDVKPYVHLIGNLFLVGQGFNSSARNFGIQRKIAELRNTGINTTADLISEISRNDPPVWTENEINLRTNQLLNLRMMYFGQGVNQMSILPSFSVIPSKTFLGLDRSKGYCFTVRKAVTPQIIEFFELTPDKLQQNIVFVTEEGEFPALLRLIVQNKFEPNKQGIKRNWKDRLVLNIS